MRSNERVHMFDATDVLPPKYTTSVKAARTAGMW